MGSLEHLAIALTVLVASGMRSYAEAAAVPDEQGRQDDQSGTASTASNGRGPASPFGYLGGVVRDTQGNPEKVYNFVVPATADNPYEACDDHHNDDTDNQSITNVVADDNYHEVDNAPFYDYERVTGYWNGVNGN
ncbi:hypothetical protein MTO96_049037 [Rhipicephalus appendiculatus]